MGEAIPQADFGPTDGITGARDIAGFSEVDDGGALELVAFFPALASGPLLPLSSAYGSLTGRSLPNLEPVPPGLRSPRGRCRPTWTVSHCPSSCGPASFSFLVSDFVGPIVEDGIPEIDAAVEIPLMVREFPLFVGDLMRSAYEPRALNTDVELF